jgi:predicted permease
MVSPEKCPDSGFTKIGTRPSLGKTAWMCAIALSTALAYFGSAVTCERYLRVPSVAQCGGSG